MKSDYEIKEDLKFQNSYMKKELEKMNGGEIINFLTQIALAENHNNSSFKRDKQ